MQTSSDNELKAVFNDEDMQGILLETGFRIPVTSLSIQNREEIVSILKDYYSITRVRKFALIMFLVQLYNFRLKLRLINSLRG